LEHNHVLVDGTINGQKISVMLDTGSMRTLILRTAAVRLGLTRSDARRVRMFGVGGESKVEIVLVDEFRIGQMERRSWQVYVAGEHDFGHEVTVLLGEDFFQRVDIEFDLAHNAVRLFQPKDCDGVSLAYWASDGGSEAAFEALDTVQPQVILTVEINGQPVKALLDSGASSSVLDKAHAARLGVTPETPGVTPGSGSTGLGKNVVDSWIGPFRSFTIGSETVRDTEIRFSDLFKDANYRIAGSRLSTRVQVAHSMLLGVDFLRSHRVLVAHSQRKIYFTYAGGPVFQVNRPRVLHGDLRQGDNAKPETGGN
jgi:clan AA aspartic protease (TIGR02281 family)